MKTINDLNVGEEINHPNKGKGRIIKLTKRTITVKWPFSTQKLTYRHNNAPFNISDF